jgi:hypothetical protein
MMQNHSMTLRVSPAGRRFMHFLAAFNSGSRETIEDFIVKTYADAQMGGKTVEHLVDWHLEIYESTGGLGIHRVYLSQEYYVIVIVQAKNDGTLYLDKMKVMEDAPHEIIEYYHEMADDLT